jgi:hypothetical protein
MFSMAYRFSRKQVRTPNLPFGGIEPQDNRMTPHLILLLVLGDQRPNQTGFLHRLETEEKHLQCEFLFGRRHAKVPQYKNGTKQIGLRSEDLVCQFEFLVGSHLLHCLDGPQNVATRNPAHFSLIFSLTQDKERSQEIERLVAPSRFRF